MAKKRNRYPIYKNVLIQDLTIEGKAVAKIPSETPDKGDLIVFAEEVVPGDIVDLQVKKRKRNYKLAYPIHFHKYSDDRIEPFCQHFGLCGGCKRQMLPYELQLEYKTKQIKDQLERIGKVSTQTMQPILPSPKQQYFRNKLEFTFTDRRWLLEEEADSQEPITNFTGLGFHIPGRFDKVLNIKECFLQPDLSNQIRNELKDFADKNQYSYFFLREGTGFLRNLIVRNTNQNQWMIILVVTQNEPQKINNILDHLIKKFPQIISAFYIINNKKNDSTADLPAIHYYGEKYLIQEMGNLKFKIGPKSFYQTNTEQTINLYNKIAELAELKGNEIVYDLYTGAGTIAAFLAQKAKKVVGIEYIEEAVEDARKNSALNNIDNTKFYAGDMKDIFTEELFEKEGQPETIITDPPRAGMHKDVIKAIMKSNANSIIYVSCNPATQARDLETLKQKYQIKTIQPVDMFPHTHHTENIVVLQKTP